MPPPPPPHTHTHTHITRKRCFLWFWIGVPEVPVSRVLLKRGHESMEISQFIQFSYVVPVRVWQPARAGVIHLFSPYPEPNTHIHTHTTQIALCNMRTFFIFKQVKTIFSKNPLSEPEHTHKHTPPCSSHQSPPEKRSCIHQCWASWTPPGSWRTCGNWTGACDIQTVLDRCICKQIKLSDITLKVSLIWFKKS